MCISKVYPALLQLVDAIVMLILLHFMKEIIKVLEPFKVFSFVCKLCVNTSSVVLMFSLINKTNLCVKISC